LAVLSKLGTLARSLQSFDLSQVCVPNVTMPVSRFAFEEAVGVAGRAGAMQNGIPKDAV